MRCSHGAKGRRRSKRSRLRIAARNASCAMSSAAAASWTTRYAAWCARRQWSRNSSSRAASDPPCAPRTSARSSRHRVAIPCRLYDGSAAGGPCPRYGSSPRRGPWTSRRPAAVVRSMKRRDFLVAAAAPLVAGAVPERLLAAVGGRRRRRARDRRPRVSPRRRRHELRPDREADPRLARARAASRATASARRSSRIRRSAGSPSSMPPRSRSSVQVAGLGEPRYAAMHPTERIAYVSESKRGAVAVIDLVRPGSSGGRTCPARHATSR